MHQNKLCTTKMEVLNKFSYASYHKTSNSEHKSDTPHIWGLPTFMGLLPYCLYGKATGGICFVLVLDFLSYYKDIGINPLVLIYNIFRGKLLFYAPVC